MLMRGGLDKLRLARWVNSKHRSHVVFLLLVFDQRLPGQIYIYVKETLVFI